MLFDFLEVDTFFDLTEPFNTLYFFIFLGMFTNLHETWEKFPLSGLEELVFLKYHHLVGTIHYPDKVLVIRIICHSCFQSMKMMMMLWPADTTYGVRHNHIYDTTSAYIIFYIQSTEDIYDIFPCTQPYIWPCDDTAGLERDVFQIETGSNQESMDRGSDEDQANEQSVLDM